MWIVIDILGYDPGNAVIVVDTDGRNLLFDTEEQANEWAKENCAWEWQVVEIIWTGINI